MNDELERLELLPCPFCGSADVDSSFVRGYERGDQTQPVVGAGCNTCGAVGATVRVPDHSTGYKEAAQRWNIRSDRQRRAQAAEPVPFLCNGTRFKLSFSDSGKVSALANYRDELDGRWVALVAAENDCHLKRAAPAEVTEPSLLQQAYDAALAFIASHAAAPDITKDMCAKWAEFQRAKAALGGGDV